MPKKSVKIGRNDPCPCDSGKKYKKCCLKVVRKRERVWETVQEMGDWVLEDKEFQREFQQMEAEVGSRDILTEKSMILDAFLFNYRLPSGKTPYEIYREENSIREKVIHALDNNLFSFFKIIGTEPGLMLVLKDLIGEGEYKVIEKKASAKLDEGDLVSARIAPFLEKHILVGSSVNLFPDELKYICERVFSTLDEVEKRAFSELELIKMVTGKKEVKAPEVEREDGKKDIDSIKERLESKIDTLDIGMDLSDLEERINSSEGLMEAFPEVYSHHFNSKEEMEAMYELVKDLWNNHPREEFGGKAPVEVDERGPTEELLLEELTFESMANIDPENYESLEEAKEAAKEFTDEWLRTPQEQLDGKTPRDEILEERRKLGDPDEEISIDIDIGPAFIREDVKRTPLAVSLDELLESYEKNREDEGILLDTTEEKTLLEEEVDQADEGRFLKVPCRTKDQTEEDIKTFALSLDDASTVNRVLNVLENDSPPDNLQKVLAEEDLKERWKNFVRMQKKKEILDWLSREGYDIKGKPYLDDIEIKRLDPEEIEGLDPEIKHFEPILCMECGNMVGIEKEIYRSNMPPNSDLLQEALEDIVYQRFEVPKFGSLARGGQGAYLNTATCPECGSRDIQWEYSW